MKKVYIAGSLFKDGDIKERKYEGKILKEKGMDVFNPIESPFNKDKRTTIPSAHDIFKGDTDQVLSSDYIFAELDGEDSGVMAELGIAWTISHLREYFAVGKTVEDFMNDFPAKKIIAHSTDIRQATANKYEGHYVPWGTNQYVVGLIEDKGKIFNSKLEAFDEIK